MILQHKNVATNVYARGISIFQTIDRSRGKQFKRWGEDHFSSGRHVCTRGERKARSVMVLKAKAGMRWDEMRWVLGIASRPHCLSYTTTVPWTNEDNDIWKQLYLDSMLSNKLKWWSSSRVEYSWWRTGLIWVESYQSSREETVESKSKWKLRTKDFIYIELWRSGPRLAQGLSQLILNFSFSHLPSAV